MDELLRLVVGLGLVAIGASVLGGYVVSALAARTFERNGVEPADAFDGYDPEDEDDGPEDECEGAPDPLGAEETLDLGRVVALRPMSALERLEGPTRRFIRTADGYEVRPWWHGGRHRVPESRCRIPAYLDAPQGTLELPHVSVWPTGEYEVLDGAR